MDIFLSILFGAFVSGVSLYIWRDHHIAKQNQNLLRLYHSQVHELKTQVNRKVNMCVSSVTSMAGSQMSLITSIEKERERVNAKLTRRLENELKLCSNQEMMNKKLDRRPVPIEVNIISK